jgi:hypothetical protein
MAQLGSMTILLYMNGGIVLALVLIIGCDLHAYIVHESMDESEGDAPTYSPCKARDTLAHAGCGPLEEDASG